MQADGSHFGIRRRKGSLMSMKRKTVDVGRDSETGQFIPVEEAKARPRETTIERVPKRGYGDTKGEPRGK
jgi:hypothetical protein